MVADLLRGDYKASEYGRVILPLTVLRRLDCVLEPTKAAVLLKAQEPAIQARVGALAKRIERFHPVESRLVRVHNCLWLRMWTRPQTGPIPEPSSIQDVVCNLPGN